MVDFHTHSIHSVDGHDTVLDMCESAVQKGISHLAITDHCDFGTNSVDKLGWFRYVADSENLQEKFQIAKQRYNGKLELLFGVEFGNAKWHPLICQYLTKKNHYDFILGAVHNVRHGRNIYRINFSEPKLLELCWKEYFDELDYANLKACLAPHEAAGEAFNVAYGGREYLIDIYYGLTKALGVDTEPVFGPERPGDIKHSNADIGKARRMLGYDPDWSFDRGIAAAIEWYRANLR